MPNLPPIKLSLVKAPEINQKMQKMLPKVQKLPAALKPLQLELQLPKLLALSLPMTAQNQETLTRPLPLAQVVPGKQKLLEMPPLVQQIHTMSSLKGEFVFFRFFLNDGEWIEKEWNGV